MLTEQSLSRTEAVSPSMFSVRRQMMESLRSGKEYRRSFVEEKIRTGLAIQTKAIRESREGMTQQEFAAMLGKSQSWVARLENPNSSPPTLTTLLKVADAFDVDLVVRYAPFSETVDWVSGVTHSIPGLSQESLAVPDFDHDPAFVEAVGTEESIPNTAIAGALESQNQTDQPLQNISIRYTAAESELEQQKPQKSERLGSQLKLGLLPPNVLLMPSSIPTRTKGLSAVLEEREQQYGTIERRHSQVGLAVRLQ